MSINIYGGKQFKKEMNQLLKSTDFYKNINEIQNVESLKKTINQFPNDIFLIDSDKIIQKNIITKKLNFLNSKDSIEKDILIEHGIDDMCFNSHEALLKYIINKLNNSEILDENNINTKNENQIIKGYNMADITKIDEIIEDELLNALNTSASIQTQEISDASLNMTQNNSCETDDSSLLVVSPENVDEVADLLKQLLNNKTLELSIKIKDS